VGKERRLGRRDTGPDSEPADEASGLKAERRKTLATMKFSGSGREKVIERRLICL